MAFKFTLQEVLEYRKRIEEIRQREMGEMQRQVDHVGDLIRQARDHRRNYREELSVKAQEGMSPAYQELYFNYISGLEHLIVRSEKHLEELRTELERRRVLLSHAARERMVLDELKKQEYRQYLIDERRIEQKQFDDMAIRSFLGDSREKSSESLEGIPS